MNQQIETKRENNVRGKFWAGMGLIAIGTLILAARLFNLSEDNLIVVPALGLIFLAWGIGARNVGLMIPGVLLGGVAAALLLIAGPLTGVSDEVEASVFLFAMAVGWALLVPLSAWFTARTAWWALIPGGIKAAIGVLVVVAGAAPESMEQLGTVLGLIWPVVLMVIGAYLLVRRGQASK